jgi:hypothetical protein
MFSTRPMIYWYGMWVIRHTDIKSLPAEKIILTLTDNGAVFPDFQKGAKVRMILLAQDILLPQFLLHWEWQLPRILTVILKKHHIAVVGDASIASGMAFEGLNHAGMTDANLLVILNDNAIGIDPSVGALKNYLTAVKDGKNPRQNNMIKSLNFDYSGPIDGHDIAAVIKELKRLKSIKGPKFLPYHHHKRKRTGTGRKRPGKISCTR